MYELIDAFWIIFLANIIYAEFYHNFSGDNPIHKHSNKWYMF